MKRYWISFYSGYYGDEGCTAPPFQVWISGESERRGHLPQSFESGSPKNDCTICTVVDANNENEIWESVGKHFLDYEKRFCDVVESDFVPGDRFPNFENKTTLK